MADDKQKSTNQGAAQMNPERGTQPPEESVQRKVGPRTPERVHEEQKENLGREDNKGAGNRLPEMAENQTTGGPAELDRVPLDNNGT